MMCEIVRVSTHSHPRRLPARPFVGGTDAGVSTHSHPRRLLSTSKSAKNQLITNILSLTYSDVREFGKYSARFCAIQPYK